MPKSKHSELLKNVQTLPWTSLSSTIVRQLFDEGVGLDESRNGMPGIDDKRQRAR